MTYRDLYLCAPVALAAMIVLPAGSKAQPAMIQVAPNVQVSAANGKRLHHELVVSASPTDANALLACAMIFDARDASRHVIAYGSFDGGKSWARTLEVDRTTFVGDPDCTFGLDGTAYLSALPLHYESAAEHEMLVYRSADSGRTWSAPVVLPFIDREYLAVDRTSGPRRGYLYLHGNAVRDPTVDGDERIVFTFFRSTDGGLTFSSPKKLIPDGEHMAFGTGNGVVLSDGTYVASFYEWYDRKNLSNKDFTKADGALKLVRSTDGGDHFSKAVVASEWHGCIGWTPGLPVLAVDTSGGPFRDRLYLTWPDRRSDRCEVLFSYSSDKGESWSKPHVVNDDQSPSDRERRRDHMLPSVAVNRSGVVGVAWSDRRESTDNLSGWRLRFSASLDGGETFTPSVRVSEQVQKDPAGGYMPIMAYSEGGGHHRPRARGGTITMQIGPQWIDFLTAADTTGMAATADGRFHPVWVDNRTGIPQVWTAAVGVDGEAAVNGSPELAALTDVTQSVAVEFANTDYDPAQRVVALDAALTNTSDKPILGPIKVRVISLRSGSAVPEVLDVENRLGGAGAVWDFSSGLKQGRLAAGETSRPRRLRFRLNELAPFKLDANLRLDNLISVGAKVLGGTQPR
jgi:hypothetical protein